MIYLLLLIAAAGIGIGFTVGKHTGEKKVDRELEAMVVSIQMGLKSKCPVCQQPIRRSDKHVSQ